MNKSFEIYRAKALVKQICPLIGKVYEYLDFGCGDGVFTHEFSCWLHRSKPKVKSYGYDIADLRNSSIKAANSFEFVDTLSALHPNQIDLCTVIDVVHHISSRKENQPLVVEVNALLRYIKPGGFIIIKDYYLSNKQPLYKFMQKLILSIKDIVANPREMVKGFNYLTGLEWEDLFGKFHLSLINSFPFYYLPGEKLYAKLTGQAWIWVVKKN